MKNLKIFVWPNYAPDYTIGLAFAVAVSSDDARELIAEQAGYLSESLAHRPEVYDLSAQIAFQCSGGV